MNKIKLAGYQEIVDEIKRDTHQDLHTALDTDNDYAVMEGINQDMEEVKRDFELKNMNSQISASKVILTN